MQIVFKRVAWKNLLSYGNSWTTLDLNSHKTTLIVGTNGAGKSTFLDAMAFALYGRPFRPVNKPQLINALTQKELVVELEFEVGGSCYLVRRGIKPNLFEIIKDGELIDQNAQSRDYQEMFENSILKMNQKSFSQIVVLGLANFTPFMKLTAGDRRKVIEDLLDIEIFSVMNGLLRERVSQNKAEIEANEHQVKMVESKIALHQKHLLELQQNNNAMIVEKENEIFEQYTKIKEAEKAIQELAPEMADKQTLLGGYERVQKKLQKMEQLKGQIGNNLRTVLREIELYTKNTDCPTCRQQIDEGFKSRTIAEKKAIADGFSDGLLNLETKLSEAQQEALSFAKIRDEVSVLAEKIRTKQTLIRVCTEMIEITNRDIKRLRDKSKTTITDDVTQADLEAELKATRSERLVLLHDKEVFNLGNQLLRDGGVKARIIKQYIPLLNACINKYLMALNFFAQFEIDEEFKETIKSRCRDDFTYDLFSQGEKLRIDLSLLFAWREIARMRNSVSCNLLILDEILDSSLDTNGTEDFLQIVKNLTKDTNTFIISHRIDNSDDFDRTIRFEKVANYSRMAA